MKRTLWKVPKVGLPNARRELQIARGRREKRARRGGGYAPELKNVILPTRQSNFSLITSLRRLRSMGKGWAP